MLDQTLTEEMSENSKPKTAKSGKAHISQPEPEGVNKQNQRQVINKLANANQGRASVKSGTGSSNAESYNFSRWQVSGAAKLSRESQNDK